MAPVVERIFRLTPWPVKDALCGLYGWRLHRLRYGGRHAYHLQEALAEEQLSPAELADLSLWRLRHTLVHAGREVPYYRELFAKLRFDPRTVPLPQALSRIPVLEKATVRARAQDFVSEAIDHRRLQVRETSGTTGSPLQVWADPDSLQRIYALYDRFRAWAGTAVGRRRATFNGRVLFSPRRSRPPFWVRDWSESNLLFSIYHMSAATIPAYVDRLVGYAPEEIHAYPSALVTLARFARGHGQSLPRPSSILVSAETLSATDRELLEEAFDCRVHNQYGNAEMTVFAGECPQGSLHLDVGFGYLELLGDTTGADGLRTGEAITTGFGNRAMPLIRYRTGDTVTLSGGLCSCGSPQPVIHEVIGRTDDLLRLPDGRVIGRLDPVFKGLAGLEEVQIVQERCDRVVLNVVPGSGYGVKVERAMIDALADRLGPSVEILVRQVARIPRTERGKFRAVVRLPDT